MTTIDNISGLGPGYKGYEKFIPTNLTDNPLFCEEVHVNKTEADYIISPKGKGSAVHNLQTLAGQKAFIRDGNFISFPKESLEIKADWIPAASIQSGKTFDCKNPPADLIVQTIENNCYALVAMHISSKLEPKWVWATFEAQSTMTNPNGCDPELYSNCKDPWGSKNGSTGKGQKTEPSQALLDLMKAANIDPKFKNYRLVGAQSQYYSPQVLSNSFTEFNAQVRREHASCMTCHFYTLFTKDTTPILENPNFGPFPGYAGTGNPFPVPKGWYDQDFSWLLGIMPETKEGSALKRQENKVLPRVPG
ncbi:hypothetical protein BZL54_08585 [Burkholderia ubonensis subsp. mesacidophila]|uniref:Uncharacterized protein n=2 Tax=Burkholderia ubonensis TaxID=101571 RepID=A0A2A4FK34_9BURK|nr:hypothetical protein BZL54_08585 [Burkholderia ubonensis subsp. mesacidophila]